MIGIYSIMVSGLNILMGFCGQVSLGQAAFMAVGGYSSAILTLRYGMPPVVAMGVGIFLTLIIAFVIGWVVLRLRGYYFALATFAVGIIVEQVLIGWAGLTGGPSGLAGVPNFMVGSLVFKNLVHYYFLIWIVAILVAVVSRNLLNSRVGRAFRVVATDELAAATLGVDVFKAKLHAFLLSAVIASVAGSLYAHYMNFISPEMVGMQTSLSLLLMLALGGSGTVIGPFPGSAIIYLIPTFIGRFEDYQLAVNGLLLVLLIVFLPQGLIGWLAGILSDRGYRRVHA